jgi:hypothetical protein
LTGSGRSRVLRASEIGSYAYCARGWWLSRVLGYASAHREQMAMGEEEHLSHGRAVVILHRLERLGYALVFLGVGVGLLGVIWWLASVSAV